MSSNLLKSAKFGLPLLALALVFSVGCGAKEVADSPVGKMKEMFTSVTGALEGVTDEATAKDAATKLTDVTSKLDGLGIDKLTGPAQVAKDTAVKGFKGKVEGMLEKLYAIPGAEAVLKPAIEGLMSKLGG